MSWPNPSSPGFEPVRTSHPVPSIHHQTVLSKALYEHGDCKTVSAVAASSSSIHNSSLGPNLLALIEVDKATYKLFTHVFMLTNSSTRTTTTLQFSHSLSLHIGNLYMMNQLHESLLGPLFSSTKNYFSHSLQNLELRLPTGKSLREPMVAIRPFVNMAAVRKLSLTIHPSAAKTKDVDEICQHIGQNFPNIQELKVDCKEMSDVGFLALLTMKKKDSTKQDNNNDDDDDDNDEETSTQTRAGLTSLDISHISEKVTSQKGWHSVFNQQYPTSSLLRQSLLSFETLTSLKISNSSSFKDETASIITSSPFLSKSLTSLDLSNNYNHLQFTGVGFKNAVGFPNLTSLDVGQCAYISDEGVVTIAEAFSSDESRSPLLKWFSLRNCQGITEVSSEAIGAKMKKLKFLDISWCKYIPRDKRAELRRVLPECEVED